MAGESKLLGATEWPIIGMILKVEYYNVNTGTDVTLVGPVVLIEKTRNVTAKMFGDGHVMLKPDFTISHAVKPVEHWHCGPDTAPRITILGVKHPVDV